MKNDLNAVLTNAIYMGLVALVRLASRRVDKKTRKHYVSIAKMWSEARASLEQSKTARVSDFSIVQKKETNMRKRFLKIVWDSTKRFGNKEKKRVYRWIEGTVGPLNALLNYAGARLRDLAATRYPFPTPESFQVRVYANGSKKVLSENEVEELGKDDAVKTYWRAGYRTRRKKTILLLAHPTLPEMDFVDMIRAHLVELCRQCFIHNVPRNDAHRYIRLLIHNLRPFLDWVYTNGSHGRPYFNRYSDHELRKIVTEIRTLFGKHSGREKSVTKTLDADLSKLDLGSFKERIIVLRDTIKDELELVYSEILELELAAYCEILDHIDEGNIVDRDIEKFVEQVDALRSREGTEWHRVLLSDLHHPKSLKQVIFAGDTMLDGPSSVLVVGELPVAKGKGKIDITVFIRRVVEGRTFWTPVMILEVKTKTAIGYNLYGVRSKNKKKEDYGPRLYAWKQTISEAEWKKTSRSVPIERTLKQLDAYETALRQEYEKQSFLDPTPPSSLWKGVIVLDTNQRPSEVFTAFQDLLDDIVFGVTNGLVDTSTIMSYCHNVSDSELTPRVAVILPPSEGPADLLNEMCASDSLPVDNPFEGREPDNRLLTSYVCVPSPVSYGNAAEWLSKNWHLLNHIQECIDGSPIPTKVYWLDLVGDFQDRDLTKKRFGLETLYKNGGITKRQFSLLSKILDGVDFIDLSKKTESLIKGDTSGIDMISQDIEMLIREGNSIVVVDGWTEFSEMVPYNRIQLVKELEERLLDVLPVSETNIIWVDRGTEHTKMNRHYQRKCVSPLRFDSARKGQVDEIIYNIPTPSRSFGRLQPRRDDERFIVQDTPTAARPWVSRVYVPHLVGFFSKFAGLSQRKPILSKKAKVRKDLVQMYGRLVTLSSIRTGRKDPDEEKRALTLIPSLHRFRDPDKKTPKKVGRRERSELVPSIVTHEESITTSSRLSIYPLQPPPEPHKAEEEYVTASEITREWYYHLFTSQSYGDEEEYYIVHRPPLVETGNRDEVDTYVIRIRELRRLLYSVRYLKNREKFSDKFEDCLEEIEKVCVEVLSDGQSTCDPLDALVLIVQIIRSDMNRARLWECVSPLRQGLVELLNAGNRRILQGVIGTNPDVLLLYGTNLFLAMCAVMEEVYGEISVIHAAYLFESIVEWELYQLGFKAQQEIVLSKYDFHVVYSNLVVRAKNLPGLRLPERILTMQYAGQLIWTESDGKYSAWIAFQTEKQMVTALIEDIPNELQPKWHRCVNNPRKHRKVGNLALQSKARIPLVVTKVGQHKVLWMMMDSRDDEKWTPYVLEYKTPRKNSLTIPWIKLSDPWRKEGFSNDLLIPPLHTPDVSGIIDRHLRDIVSSGKDVVEVTCDVYVDVSKREYVLDFKDTADESIVATVTYEETMNLVNDIRSILKTGEPFETPDGNLLMWDYKTGVNYCLSDLQTTNGIDEESISFLIPLVHRRSFLPGCYMFPKTCEDLLATKRGNDICLDISYHTRLGFRVELERLPDTSTLKRIERVNLNIYDIALLAECEQLIDMDAGLRHTMNVTLKDCLLDASVPDLSDYPRIDEVLEKSQDPDSYEEEEYDDSDQDYDEEDQDMDESIDYQDIEFETDDAIKDEIKVEETELLVETAQNIIDNTRMMLNMRDYDNTLKAIGRSLEILQGLEERTEEVRFAMLTALLLKDEVLGKHGQTEKDHFELIDELLEELEKVMLIEERPLHQQRSIEQAESILRPSKKTRSSEI
ncbi:MAG: hypothetical protein ACTSUO_09875 [Candidatus Thorarchaeota archaeon]